ncbi:MAG TPA: hypothetical protein VMR45_03040 [Patescibacteria group bacterium]|nr:hypothetical protein [Patescibacteria group bacterium]
MGSKKKSAPSNAKKQPVANVGQATSTDQPRRLKAPTYKSFQLQKRVKADKLPGSFRLLRMAFGTLRRHWKIFLGITVANALLTAVLVQGFSAVSLSDTNTTASLSQLLHGHVNQLGNSASLFVYLLGSSGQSLGGGASVYRLFVGLVVSLALIWALRQVYASHKARIRDSFYQGMTPLVPFIIVLIVICLQLLPFIIGLMAYSSVVSNGIAATEAEHVLWAVLFFLMTILSLYMISSSIFSLYIVCLPGLTPLAALKSAKQLVAHRRWEVMRKVVFLPIALLVLSALIIVPLILIAAPIAPTVFFILSVALLTIIHSYLYALYRAML